MQKNRRSRQQYGTGNKNTDDLEVRLYFCPSDVYIVYITDPTAQPRSS